MTSLKIADEIPWNLAAFRLSVCLPPTAFSDLHQLYWCILWGEFIMLSQTYVSSLNYDVNLIVFWCMLTDICLSGNMFRACVIHNIDIQLRDLILHPCHNFNNGLAEYIMKDRMSNYMSQKICDCFSWPLSQKSYGSKLGCQSGEIITFIIKCGMKLLIHSQTSSVQPLKFGNG